MAGYGPPWFIAGVTATPVGILSLSRRPTFCRSTGSSPRTAVVCACGVAVDRARSGCPRGARQSRSSASSSRDDHEVHRAERLRLQRVRDSPGTRLPTRAAACWRYAYPGPSTTWPPVRTMAPCAVSSATRRQCSTARWRRAGCPAWPGRTAPAPRRGTPRPSALCLHHGDAGPGAELPGAERAGVEQLLRDRRAAARRARPGRTNTGFTLDISR